MKHYWHSVKLKEIQRRMGLSIRYFRLVNRLTENKISKKTGINFYLISNGSRPISILTLVKLESVFGTQAIKHILNSAWNSNEAWSEGALKKQMEKEHHKQNKNKSSQSSGFRYKAPVSFRQDSVSGFV